MSRKSMMHVMHTATGETALGRRAPDGCILVQFDRFDHPQSHGWHLYPRSHFQRKTFYYTPFERMVRIPTLKSKGVEGGYCNRTACMKPPARWFNHGSRAWYCEACATLIGQDVVNLADWEKNFQPRLGHPMFETREMMDARK